MTPVPAADVAAIRAFNRAYTARLGLLAVHLDGSPFTLSEARMIYEIANRDGPTAADLGRALGIDRAQTSRTLKRFVSRGLVTAEARPDHGRNRSLFLTEAGKAAFAALDAGTNAAITRLAAALSPSRRQRLLSAARTFITAFDDLPSSGLVLRQPREGDLGWIVHRQAVLYAQEYGWTAEYEGLVARILGDYAEGADPRSEAAWIAELDGDVVGSVFLMKGDDPAVGKLRLLYVEPHTRGQGVGRTLVDACIQRARAVGYQRLELWTNSVLTAARHIYQGAGFVLVRTEPHHSFGHDLVGETWSLALNPPTDP
ncbi:helix-turn-helix domain-containing GNAT family N-acetyltransferase [Brevundimonas sp.]|uniref:bifunctional helix-turn-helix transcriptional regulator/GNAT family N-acetyltransferase n=1 Tax=Brevundimonas sp. TaxID=1871086 RepID=UPI0026183CB6|nr:helix-turn-helix domain-containing GNAT family N-acetyltransferase [Brevundimonas sp.]